MTRQAVMVMAVMVMAVMVMAVMACSFQVGTPTTVVPLPTVMASPTPTKIRIVIMVTPSAQETTIVAPEGVRLRSRPDAAGPVDSVELTILHPGDTFIVQSCELVYGKFWAYGTFHTIDTIQDFQQGWVIARYLSPNPCK